MRIKAVTDPGAVHPGALGRWFRPERLMVSANRMTSFFGAELLAELSGASNLGLPERGGGPDNARQLLRDPGGGWPLGRQAGSPGEFSPTPLYVIAAVDPGGVSNSPVRLMMSCSPKQLCSTPECHPVLGRRRVWAPADVVWVAAPGSDRFVPDGSSPEVRTQPIPRRQAHAVGLRPAELGRRCGDQRVRRPRCRTELRTRHAARGAQPRLSPRHPRLQSHQTRTSLLNSQVEPCRE